MGVRNFYVEGNIDGRQTLLKGGPPSREGEMTVQLFQRKDCEIVKTVRIECTVEQGALVTRVLDPDGNCVYEYHSARGGSISYR